jgi:ankyrin repeat protein
LKGKTALHLAAQKGHEAIVQILIQKGANVEAKDVGGKTALYWAAQDWRIEVVEVVEVLVENGAKITFMDNRDRATVHRCITFVPDRRHRIATQDFQRP